MSSLLPTPTTAASPPAQTTQGSNKGGPTSSPLLFFVALGFGVVFTNLWIIVGVKYCFRYNQRNRAARAAANGEPIDLTAMPRPHRRRREKKLMSMDEVNERFPLTKYKAWKASREDEGLPAEGGITTAPPSRAASLKEVGGIMRKSVDDGGSNDRPATALSNRPETPIGKSAAEQQPTSPKEKESATALEKEVGPEIEKKDKAKAPELVQVETVSSHYAPAKPGDEHDHDAEDSDEDDAIAMAATPEAYAEPGDNCAICLDALENEDDVRGLTCGHAFHAGCLDPWLTSRRACCPLCKSDYYIPKPRPEGETVGPAVSGGRRAHVTGLRSPTAPAATWVVNGGRGNPFTRPRVVFVNTRDLNSNANSQRYGLQGMFDRPTRRNRSGNRVTPPQPTASGPGWRARLAANRPSMSVLWPRRNRGDGSTGSNNDPGQATPSQLEAGNR
ncbi:hypothetical protein GQ43DRAFT_483568 [Delitschia confertaspora ATCC 74209]|uniref:RING-type domain-containing protein n=1 Tax=Delitschia confertaspora ATCC 74209 TaxID=1513339 RepID=A0A9P4JH07_9PLEO|nr:hypothetical protein GQ43DRAFT_483568 [Delitschia confertaspora ATCC 74209]